MLATIFAFPTRKIGIFVFHVFMLDSLQKIMLNILTEVCYCRKQCKM